MILGDISCRVSSILIYSDETKLHDENAVVIDNGVSLNRVIYDPECRVDLPFSLLARRQSPPCSLQLGLVEMA
jgi:hypothetical protein